MLRKLTALSFFSVALLVAVIAVAAPPATTITCSEMCGGCAKKITAKLQTLPEVGSIQCDTKTRTVTVVPRSGKSLSALTLWTAMESIEKTPVKLSGPECTFSSKPGK